MDKPRLKGFGLIEMLFVLMIISVLLMVSYYYVPQAKSITTVQEEINQLLVEAHLESLLHQKRIQVDVTDEGLSVNFEHGVKRYTGISVEGESFAYTENGTISKSQTWSITYGNKAFEIVFYLGSGYVDYK